MPYDEVCYQRLEDDSSNHQDEVISLSLVLESDGECSYFYININSTYLILFLLIMKCKYCEKVFEDNADVVFNYFYHVDANHYGSLSDDEKIMHDVRKKMIKSKTDYDVYKKTNGDSDLIFNSKNSDI